MWKNTAQFIFSLKSWKIGDVSRRKEKEDILENN